MTPKHAKPLGFIGEYQTFELIKSIHQDDYIGPNQVTTVYKTYGNCQHCRRIGPIGYVCNHEKECTHFMEVSLYLTEEESFHQIHPIHIKKY